MAISPLKPVEDRAIKVDRVIPPSKTRAYDFDAEEFTGDFVDGIEAVRQFIRKAISTARYRFQVYSSNYGCGLDTLIGEDIPVALLDMEIPRVITDALIYDGRIRAVRNFNISRSGDGLYVSFTVDTIFGETSEGVTL